MGDVQETLFDKALLEGQGSPKFHYSAREALAAQDLRKKYEKNMWETEWQSAEKKTACDKRDSGENSIALLALAYQKLGCSQKKYHAETMSRQRIREEMRRTLHRRSGTRHAVCQCSGESVTVAQPKE